MGVGVLFGVCTRTSVRGPNVAVNVNYSSEELIGKCGKMERSTIGNYVLCENFSGM